MLTLNTRLTPQALTPTHPPPHFLGAMRLTAPAEANNRQKLEDRLNLTQQDHQILVSEYAVLRDQVLDGE